MNNVVKEMKWQCRHVHGLLGLMIGIVLQNGEFEGGFQGWTW